MRDMQLNRKEQLSIIEAARKRLGDNDRWTRFVSARDGSGEACCVGSTDARQWCLSGAIACEANKRFHDIGPERFGPRSKGKIVGHWLDTVTRLLQPAIARVLDEPQSGRTLEDFNDHYASWEDVVKLLDDVVAGLRQNREVCNETNENV